jgi:hypothetical protein
LLKIKTLIYSAFFIASRINQKPKIEGTIKKSALGVNKFPMNGIIKMTTPEISFNVGC